MIKIVSETSTSAFERKVAELIKKGYFMVGSMSTVLSKESIPIFSIAMETLKE
jgi:hypothetical protein